MEKDGEGGEGLRESTSFSLISRARAETRRGRREERGGTGIGGWENEIWELWGVLGRKGGGGLYGAGKGGEGGCKGVPVVVEGWWRVIEGGKKEREGRREGEREGEIMRGNYAWWGEGRKRKRLQMQGNRRNSEVRTISSKDKETTITNTTETEAGASFSLTCPHFLTPLPAAPRPVPQSSFRGLRSVPLSPASPGCMPYCNQKTSTYCDVTTFIYILWP